MSSDSDSLTKSYCSVAVLIFSLSKSNNDKYLMQPAMKNIKLVHHIYQVNKGNVVVYFCTIDNCRINIPLQRPG